jgi:hypothetical protein
MSPKRRVSEDSRAYRTQSMACRENSTCYYRPQSGTSAGIDSFALERDAEKKRKITGIIMFQFVKDTTVLNLQVAALNLRLYVY